MGRVGLSAFPSRILGDPKDKTSNYLFVFLFFGCSLNGTTTATTAIQVRKAPVGGRRLNITVEDNSYHGDR